MVRFTHLHVHSHYSVLDGMSKVPDLISKAMKNGMYALALTDHGNMYGIKDLMDTAKSVNEKTKDKIKEQEKILAKEDASEEEKANASKIHQNGSGSQSFTGKREKKENSEENQNAQNEDQNLYNKYKPSYLGNIIDISR